MSAFKYPANKRMQVDTNRDQDVPEALANYRYYEPKNYQGLVKYESSLTPRFQLTLPHNIKRRLF